MADSVEKQMFDQIKDALSRRNNMDDRIRDLDTQLRQAKRDRDAITETAFRLRMAGWALDGKTGVNYTADHATGENDKMARGIREANPR